MNVVNCPHCGKRKKYHSGGGTCPDGPVECDCDSPAPDGIGECSQCRRRVMPDRR